MLMDYLIILVPAVVVIVLLWMFWSKKHLRYLRSRIRDEWELLDENLRKRQSLVPNLVETVRNYIQAQEEMLGRLIERRMKAAREYNVGAEKIILENELTESINRVIDLGRTHQELSLDTNFLELRKEINDLERNTEEKCRTFNQMVRKYNTARDQWWMKPWAKLFGFEREDIFEFEV